jgi:hypothetical protein
MKLKTTFPIIFHIQGSSWRHKIILLIYYLNRLKIIFSIWVSLNHKPIIFRMLGTMGHNVIRVLDPISYITFSIIYPYHILHLRVNETQNHISNQISHLIVILKAQNNPSILLVTFFLWGSLNSKINRFRMLGTTGHNIIRVLDSISYIIFSIF